MALVVAAVVVVIAVACLTLDSEAWSPMPIEVSIASVNFVCRPAASSRICVSAFQGLVHVTTAAASTPPALATPKINSDSAESDNTSAPTAPPSALSAVVNSAVQPASPALCAVCVSAVFRRSQVLIKPSVSPSMVLSASVNGPKKSRAANWPLLTSSTNCASVRPKPLAARPNAPGKRSPNCWRSSSIDTTPLDAI